MKKKIAVTLDEDIINKIVYLAEKEDRNTSSQINKILKDYFKNKES